MPSAAWDKQGRPVVHLEEGDEAIVSLPNGVRINLLYSKQEEEQLPELDIMLSNSMAINCYNDGLVPSSPIGEHKNVLLGKQIIIPIESE